MADAHADELDRISRDVCSSAVNVQFVPLESAGTANGAYPYASDQFARWGCRIADQLSATLPEHAAGAEVEIDELRRQAAVDTLHFSDREASPRLRRIVEKARQAFGTESALFTVLDGDTQLHVGRSGVDFTSARRSVSFCQYAILERDGVIVENALEDERFRDNPLVTGEPHIRFYAGFPVESPEGERIGAVCVFDSVPRRVEEVDASLLRELAHLVQRELWRHRSETLKVR